MENHINGKNYRVEFQVVQEDLIPLLSRNAAEGMDLITVNYPNVKQLYAVGTGRQGMVEEF